MLNIKKGNKYTLTTQLFDTYTGSMIPAGTKIKIDEVQSNGTARVRDSVGRVLWVKSSDISVY